jgi:hypothetical protein
MTASSASSATGNRLGATAFLFISEPSLHFPAAFGIEEHFDAMFAHNVSTVDCP